MDIVLLVLVAVTSSWWRQLGSANLFTAALSLVTAISIWLKLKDILPLLGVIIILLLLGFSWASIQIKTPPVLETKSFAANFKVEIDPNFYFFANHPNERSGIQEVERFNFYLWPVFVIGLLLLATESWFVVLFAYALAFATFINWEETGPMVIFPFIVVMITRGIVDLLTFVKHRGEL